MGKAVSLLGDADGRVLGNNVGARVLEGVGDIGVGDTVAGDTGTSVGETGVEVGLLVGNLVGSVGGLVDSVGDLVRGDFVGERVELLLETDTLLPPFP